MAEAAPASPRRATLLLYAAPAVPLALLGLPLSVYLPVFWSQDMGLGLASVGFTLAAVRSLDVIFDPLIGRLSDGWRSRFGRRKPFIAAAMPVAAAGIAGLFFPPAGAGVAWLFACNALVTLGWTMISLPYQAWGAELSDDYSGRTRITAWREAGTLLGILASAAAPALLGISGAAASLHLLAAMTLVLAGPAMAAMLRCVPERPHAPEQRAGLADALRTIRRNAPFRRLLAAWLLNGIANGLPATLFLLVVTHLLAAPAAAGPLLLLYLLAGIAGVPLWARLARRIGKHRAWALSMLVVCVFFAPVPLLGPGDAPLFAVICVLTGLGLGGDLALPPAIQADVVDLDEVESGERRAGLFFAAWTMAQKAGAALAAGIALPLLDLAGFRTAGGNSAGALLALAALYALAPVALKLAAAALMWRFPLDAATQLRLRAAIGGAA